MHGGQLYFDDQTPYILAMLDGGKGELDPHHRNYNTDEEHP